MPHLEKQEKNGMIEDVVEGGCVVDNLEEKKEGGALQFKNAVYVVVVVHQDRLQRANVLDQTTPSSVTGYARSLK